MPATEPPSDPRPTHIHDHDATTTRCGIKMSYKERFPYVDARYVQMHIDGRASVGKPFPLCPECAEGGWPDAE